MQSLTPEQWAEIWDAINVEFPPFRTPAEALARQGASWYRELRTFSASAVADAWREHRRTSTKRPHLRDLLEGSRAYAKRLRDEVDIKPPMQAVDDDLCPCGCGGQRWARVLANGWTRDELHCVRMNSCAPQGFTLLRHDDRGVPVYGVNAAHSQAA